MLKGQCQKLLINRKCQKRLMFLQGAVCPPIMSTDVPKKHSPVTWIIKCRQANISTDTAPVKCVTCLQK